LKLATIKKEGEDKLSEQDLDNLKHLMGHEHAEEEHVHHGT
jgi:hypothetical protein